MPPETGSTAPMRIRIIQRPNAASIDGVRLDRFEPGQCYDVGNALGSLLLAEGWAEPMPLDEAVPVTSKAAPVVPPRPPASDSPPNLIRERSSPMMDALTKAGDFRWWRQTRH